MEAEMAETSASMDYEHAAELRDQIVAIRSQLEGTTSNDVIKNFKTGAEKAARSLQLAGTIEANIRRCCSALLQNSACI